MNKPEQTRAWHQAIACSVVVAIGVGLIVASRHRPVGADELKIPISLLRSQAGELVLLTQRAPHLPQRFVAAQSEQLSERIQSARKDLESLRLQSAGFEATRAHVLPLASELAESAQSVGGTRPASFKSWVARQEQLAAAERSLQR
jgi:hypothetical protein